MIENNKISIIFSDNKDITTNKVIDWLHYFGVDVIRLNEDDGIEKFIIQIFICNNITTVYINENKLHSVWFRRYPKKKFINFNYSPNIDIHLNQEIETFTNGFYNAVNNSEIKVIGKNNQYLHPTYINKIYSILMAQKVGLKAPTTLLTTNISSIFDFQEKYDEIISKPISDSIFLWGNVKNYAMYTTKIEERDLETNNEKIFPAQIQEYIQKQFELRVFFLDGKCYSAAIFSQKDENTKIDFRQYNDVKPNRIVPFKLPKNQEQKIIKFMALIGLNTGSIDMIVDNLGEYYFLEVNPCGQLGMISQPCNYYLEREIAFSLC